MDTRRAEVKFRLARLDRPLPDSTMHASCQMGSGCELMCLRQPVNQRGRNIFPRRETITRLWAGDFAINARWHGDVGEFMLKLSRI